LLETSLSSNPAITADENLALSWLLSSVPSLHKKGTRACLAYRKQVQDASLQTIY
jgi:hypothetical protein